MYARLWWKEARVFWPIWIVLGVVALGVQGLILRTDLPEARTGMLIPLGLGWSLLYAFAVGSAVFAAEREANTQVFLDTLPVGRTMLWTSKVSFAVPKGVSVRPAFTATIRCMSEKLSMGRPSMATTTSPGWSPAAAAALSG